MLSAAEICQKATALQSYYRMISDGRHLNRKLYDEAQDLIAGLKAKLKTQLSLWGGTEAIATALKDDPALSLTNPLREILASLEVENSPMESI